MNHERYPEMFSEIPHGASCGKGWDSVIRSVCHLIAMRSSNRPQLQGFKWTQIKEKWGVLQMRHNGVSDEFIDGAIRMAEEVSGYFCEECGVPGMRRNEAKTLCIACNERRGVDNAEAN